MKIAVGHAGTPEHQLAGALIEMAAAAGIALQGKVFDGGGEARRVASVHEGMSEVSLGLAETVRWTYRAEGAYDGWRHTSLRALATIQHTQWLGVAARWESGIGSLADLRDARNLRLLAPLPGGASATWAFVTGKVLGAHGASPAELVQRGWRSEDISSAESRLERADFDVLIAPLGAPGSAHARLWHSASELANLRFFAVPDTLLDTLEADHGLARGTVPAGYLRGIAAPLTTVCFDEWIVFASERLEDAMALKLVDAFEKGRHKLLPLHASLDPLRPLDDLGLPVHRAVKRDRQQLTRIAVTSTDTAAAPADERVRAKALV
jgi:TRAP-type uncharacterized transport system substrate-binding protein